MRFLRYHEGKQERVFMSDSFNASERSHALRVLGGAVLLARHPFDHDRQSGSSNCWCGFHQSELIHSIISKEK